jgi:hypothetical protein
MGSVEDIVSAIRKLVPLSAVDAFENCRFDAYCRTLCADQFSDYYPSISDNLPTLQASKNALQAALVGDIDDFELTPAVWAFLIVVADVTKGRQLFTTKGGHIGLCPHSTKPDDQISVVLGCPAPLILRPSADGRYQIVGECYVLGFMAGEALLGPLPNHYDRIVQIDASGFEYNAYIDRQIGKIYVQDPRLGPLPGNWRIKPHTKDYLWSWFVNDKTGEGHDGNALDPRLTAQALRDRRVSLQLFEFV